MRERFVSTGHRRIGTIRRLITGVAVAGVALAAAPVLAPGGDPVRLAAQDTCPAARGLQMAEANIKSGMTQAQTAADLRKVFADRPDFVAMNEVSGRADSLLAPSGYAIWRTPGRYTGANPVVWRTDRWTAIAQGTMFVSNVPGKLATQSTELGIRYANWVTVRSGDGCQTVSVVSYHVAPKTDPIGNLLLPSVAKLGGLARQLAADGPVLLAGDLNQHLRGRLYPRSLLASYQMTPTWDMSGQMLPTHGNATIDYIFVRDASQFTLTRQVTRALNSDHDAVIANLALSRSTLVPRPAPTFVRGHVVNIPDSPLGAGRRAVITRLLTAIRLAPAGSTILVATGRLDGSGLRNALIAAFRRGVAVRLVSWSEQRSLQEKILMDELGEKKTHRSYAIRRPYSASAGLPPTAMVFSTSAGVRMLGIQADQPMDACLVNSLVRAQFTAQESDYLRLRDAIRKQLR